MQVNASEELWNSGIKKRKGVYVQLQQGGEISRSTPNKLAEVWEAARAGTWSSERATSVAFMGRQICDTQLKFSLQALQDLQASLDWSPVLRKAGVKWQFSFKIKWGLKLAFEFLPLFESENQAANAEVQGKKECSKRMYYLLFFHLLFHIKIKMLKMHLSARYLIKMHNV